MGYRTVIEIAHSRELHLLGGSWADVLAVDVGTVSSLFSKVDRPSLIALHEHTDKAASFDVLVGEKVTSLWLGGTRLAVLER